MTASEKVAYLKGLADGLDIDKESREGRLFMAALDVLESLAADVEDLEANTADLADAIDDIGEDMAYLEDLCIGNLEDEDEEMSGCSGNCASCGSECDCEAEYEVVCPKCGETITVYEDDLDFGSIPCPICGEELEFDLDDDGEDE